MNFIKKIDYQKKENKIKFYKNLLLMSMCALENLNEKNDQLIGVSLKGLFKDMVHHIDDYDNLFEKLYENINQPIIKDNNVSITI